MKPSLESDQQPNQKYLRRTASRNNNNKRKLNDDGALVLYTSRAKKFRSECASGVIKKIRL